MRKNKVVLWMFIFLMNTLCMSCSSSDCPLNNVVRCYYTVFSSHSHSAASISDTLTISANDTILLNRSTLTNKFDLPMGFTQPTDTLLFRFSSRIGAVVDTIVVSHTNIPSFVSLDCSYGFFHNISQVSWSKREKEGIVSTTIDSIIIIKSNVNYDQLENLRIYISAD